MATAYLDHAATTALRPEALAALTAELAMTANASSLHTGGRRARRIIEESRESVAADLAVRPSDVVFTSGGTESDNLAIKGSYWARREVDPALNTVLVGAVEHRAVLDAANWLGGAQGARVVRLEVDSAGRVDPATVIAALQQYSGTVAVVSVMWANNETGVIQPIDEIAAACQRAGVPFHCDGVQAVAWLPAPGTLAVVPNAISVSGHKFGGPVGIGALVLRDTKVVPLLHGGGQELDVRSGTLMTAQAAGLAAALRAAVEQRAQLLSTITTLRDDLISRVRQLVPDAQLNGGTVGPRLPNIAQLSFPDCQADALLMLLDAGGVECSAGSACTAGVSRPSHVLLAMGLDGELARGALRFSLGWNSTQDDVDHMLGILPDAVARARRAGDSARARTPGKTAGVKS